MIALRRGPPWLAAMGAIVAAGCAGAPAPLEPDGTASADPRVEAEFRWARDLFEAKDMRAADAAFDSFVGAHGRDPLARPARLFRARIALSLDDPRAARAILADLAKGTDAVAERARFLDAVAVERLGRHREALTLLEPFVGRLTDPEDILFLHETLWRAALADADIPAAISWLDSYLARGPEGAARGEALTVLHRIIGEQSDLAVLRDIADRLEPKNTAWTLIMAHMADAHVAAGRLAEAAELLKRVERQGLGESPEIAEIVQALERRANVDLHAVGCILPLSGRARLVGEEALRGAMQGGRALSVFADGLPISVAMRDTRGDPAAAAAAVDDLVARERVTAIVGPIDGAEVEAAAVRAEELGVPLFAMTAQDELPQKKGFVFREFATARSEARALVRAAAAAGKGRFAVLYPDNGFGRTMHRLLGEELGPVGGRLVAAVAYKAGATSFTAEAKTLSRGETFEALFVPGSGGTVALIAPALASAGLWSAPPGAAPAGPGRAVQILLPSTALTPDLVRRAGRYLEGALFAAHFAPEATIAAADFAARFNDEYKAAPTYVAAFAHDAVVLVAAAIRGGAKDREAVRRWLASKESAAGDLPLATPFLGFDERGEPLALPWLLRLADGAFEVVR